MKSISSYIKLSLIVLFVGIAASSSQAQCATDALADACASQLNNDYTYLKTMKVELAKTGQGKDYIEYSNVFSKGNTYMLKVCDDSNVNGDMIVELYDRSRKLLATNYDAKNDKFYPAIAYSCKATSLYYIKFKFKNGVKDCGLGVLGFK